MSSLHHLIDVFPPQESVSKCNSLGTVGGRVIMIKIILNKKNLKIWVWLLTAFYFLLKFFSGFIWLLGFCLFFFSFFFWERGKWYNILFPFPLIFCFRILFRCWKQQSKAKPIYTLFFFLHIITYNSLIQKSGTVWDYNE